MVGWHHQLDVSLSKLQEMVKDREAWCAAVHGGHKESDMTKWSFSFSISPSNEYSGLISFTIDWVDFLAVQGTLKSLFQHHNSRAPIL